jgi:hypothetical protein
MEDRPEHFSRELAQIGKRNQRRWKVGAMGASLGQCQLEDVGAGRTHTRHMRGKHLLRVGIDDRTDIGREERGVADAQFLHRAFQHLHHPVGDVFLQAEDAQGRAALARAVERRRERICHDLLG